MRAREAGAAEKGYRVLSDGDVLSVRLWGACPTNITGVNFGGTLYYPHTPAHGARCTFRRTHAKLWDAGQTLRHHLRHSGSIPFIYRALLWQGTTPAVLGKGGTCQAAVLELRDCFILAPPMPVPGKRVMPYGHRRAHALQAAVAGQ